MRRKIEAYGQTWSLSALASRAGLLPETLAYRIDVKGMRPEDACEALTPRQRRALEAEPCGCMDCSIAGEAVH